MIFEFFLRRSNQEKIENDKYKQMIANLKKGDKVVTQGGIIGNIHYVNDDGTLSVEIADNVNVKVAKGMIADIAAK
jgi:preprotein translocase subunit YajC